MKTIVCGDIHLKQALILPRVAACVSALGAERVVFMGDYTDGPMLSEGAQAEALIAQRVWAESMRARGVRVEFLLGNHDAAYLGGRTCSKTREWLAPETRALLEQLGPVAATCAGGRLLTHAGVCAEWAAYYLGDVSGVVEVCDALNSLAAEEGGIMALSCVGPQRGGFDMPGPLWADRRELVGDPFPGVSQIVAHSPRRTCLEVSAARPAKLVGAYAGYGVEGSGPGAFGVAEAADASLWFCDTHAVSLADMAPSGDGSLLVVDEETGGVSPVHPEDFGCEPWRDVCFEWLSRF